MSELIFHDYQIESVGAEVAKVMAGLKEPPPLSLSEWADEHFYLSAESSSIPGRWETLPYQKAIMDCISNDDIQTITMQKSARVGYTKIIVAAVGYFTEHKKRNQVLYQPTDSDAEDFTKDEIDTMIRDVECVGDVLKCEPDVKSKHNTISKKSFIGSTLDIKGGKSARNYRRLTKDVAYYDELDGFAHDIDGEGSPISLGDTRLETATFPKSVRGSTPRLKGASHIETSFEDADVKLYRHVVCQSCDSLFVYKWPLITWEKDDPSSAMMACPECSALNGYEQHPKMDSVGIWKTLDGKVAYDEEHEFFVDKNNDRIEFPGHVGFFIWGAYSYFSSWAKLAIEFVKAARASKQGDITQLKTFTNTRLAETWAEQGDQVDDMSLFSRREEYDAEMPDGALFLTAGGDVQADRIEVEIVGWGSGVESWGVKYAVIWGDTTQDKVYEDLDNLLDSVFYEKDGTQHAIKALCLDSGYNTQIVYDYVKKRANRGVFAIKGVAGAGRPLISAPSRKRSGKSRRKIDLFTIGVDEAKGIVMARLKVTKPGPGYCHFPMEYDEEFFAQITAEKQVTRYKKGFPYKEWQATRPRNEALDCRVYATAAMRLVDPIWPALEKRRAARKKRNGTLQETAPKAEIVTATDTAKPKKKRRARRRRHRKGYVNAWR